MIIKELDSDTFKVMWELSAPGGAAEACFLRLPQIEYYGQKSELDPHHLSWMPDVRGLFGMVSYPEMYIF